jgi:hypothetical protein
MARVDAITLREEEGDVNVGEQVVSLKKKVVDANER